MQSVYGAGAEPEEAPSGAATPPAVGQPSRRVQAVFLDRDGVVNVNRADHVKSWEEFEFLPGAVEAIVTLSQAGLAVFVITNQAIINRGMVARAVVEWINLRMQQIVEERGGCITAVVYCPHRTDEQCGCRKPEPGLLFKLAHCYGVDLAASIVVGDAVTDIQAARAAGCRAILVLTGRGHEHLARARAIGGREFVVAHDLHDAVGTILRYAAGPLAH